MGKIAFLFAGQGAQKPGMGKDLYDAGGAAAAVFDTAEALRPGTLKDCFGAPPERLAQTNVTQPCVYTVALAAAEALRAAGVQPQGVAGFSLGEMAALTFAGAFTPKDGFALVCRRGELMQDAATAHPGTMAAVLKLPAAKVEELCEGFAQVWPVNYNCEGQLVVAGDEEEMPAFCAAVKEAGGLARPLAVGGAFHSPFMAGASKAFLKEVKQSGMALPKMPVYANLSAMPYIPPLEGTLAAQMCNPVRWQATMTQMGKDGFSTFIEVGPGKTLTGLAKRILPEAQLFTVQDKESLHEVLAALA